MNDVIKLLPDGVYLGLDEKIYFAQERLGTTDESKLFLTKEGFWWSSDDLNPDREAEADDNTARIFGRALHALVLEGKPAYEERFAIIPTKAETRTKAGDDPTFGSRYCETVGDMETALEKRGMNPKRMKKDALIAYCQSRAPDLVIWDVFEAEWRAANQGKAPVTGPEHRQLMIMADAVWNHPDVGPLFQFGPDHVPLSEVSILWSDEHGLRHRARLDAMLPETTIDVKTLANIGMRPLSFAAGDHVVKMGYHVQMASQHLARKHAYRFIQQGKVYGGSELQRTWLARFPREAPNWDYAWLFYQKPDAKKGMAPIILPWGEDYGSELHMDGVRARREAIETYRRCMAQFGPDIPWTRVEPLHTTREGAPNRIFLPAHVAMPAQIGENDDL